MWTDKNCSAAELSAAMAFWRQYHNQGARRRLRDAIRYYRRYR